MIAVKESLRNLLEDGVLPALFIAAARHENNEECLLGDFIRDRRNPAGIGSHARATQVLEIMESENWINIDKQPRKIVISITAQGLALVNVIRQALESEE